MVGKKHAAHYFDENYFGVIKFLISYKVNADAVCAFLAATAFLPSTT